MNEYTGKEAATIRDWSRENLIVPDGPMQGEPFTIDEWQYAWLKGAYAPGVREAGLSVARKNGKSGLIAAVLLTYLDGPLGWEYWRGLVTSETGALAAELRDAVRKTAEMSELENIRVVKTPAPGVIYGRDGMKVDILAADRSSGHATGVDLALIDEAGLLRENKRELWNAVYSAISGRNGRFWCISIQGDGPMFREMRERGRSKSTHFTIFEPPLTCNLDDVAAWHAANPGLVSGIKSIDYMRDAAERAIMTPADEAAFRAYDLNQPQDPTREMICSVTDWEKNVVDDPPEREGNAVLGLEIGGPKNMCCAVAVWPNGRVEAWGAFPSIPDLKRRGKGDAVGNLYVQMETRGEVAVYPGRITPVEAFLCDVVDDLDDVRVSVVACNVNRKAEVIDALEALGVRWRVAWRSSPDEKAFDIRRTQRLILGGRLAMRENLMIESAIRDSSIVRNADMEMKLEKARFGGRINALEALVCACGRTKDAGGEKKGGLKHAVT